MPIFIQEKLLRWILYPLSHLTEKIPLSVRNAAVSFSIAGILFMQFAVQSGVYTGRFLFQFAIGCCLWGIVILAGLTPELRPVRFSPVLSFCWLVIAFFMLLTGVLIETDSLSGAITWLIVLPMLFLVWNGANFDRLISLVIQGVLISFLFFAVISVFFYPINGINYASFYMNRNGTGVYLAAVFVCLLCYIFSQERYSYRMLVADMAIGFVVATLYYTNCRTAIFATIICLSTAGVLQIFTRKNVWRQVVLFQLLPIVVAVAIMVPASICLYHYGYHLTTSVQMALNPSDTSGPSGTPDAPNSSDTPSLSTSEVLETMGDYNTSRFNTEGIISNQEDLSSTGNALNNITAGRVGLWTAYLREVGFLGHRSDTVLYDSNGNEIGMYSHFTIIQFAYNYGVLAGVFFLLLNILAGFSSIRFAVMRQDVKYRLTPFAIAIAFGAVSVMEAIGGFFTDSLSMLYFLSFTPLLTAPVAEQQPGENLS